MLIVLQKIKETMQFSKKPQHSVSPIMNTVYYYGPFIKLMKQCWDVICWTSFSVQIPVQLTLCLFYILGYHPNFQTTFLVIVLHLVLSILHIPSHRTCPYLKNKRLLSISLREKHLYELFAILLDGETFLFSLIFNVFIHLFKPQYHYVFMNIYFRLLVII